MVQSLEKDLQTRNGTSVKILEIGPGTGIFTEAIQSLIRPYDHFDVIEQNEHFYDLIYSRFQNGNTKVYHGDVLQYQANSSYDFIFSSVPYESLPEDISTQIWQKKLELSHQGTIITYYKYLKPNQFRCSFEKETVKRYLIEDKVILRNIPPAKMYTLCINQQDELS